MEVLTPDVDKGSQVEGRWCLENNTNIYSESCFQFSSVTQLCLILCDPVDCSMPGFFVLHHLSEIIWVIQVAEDNFFLTIRLRVTWESLKLSNQDYKWILL